MEETDHPRRAGASLLLLFLWCALSSAGDGGPCFSHLTPEDGAELDRARIRFSGSAEADLKEVRVNGVAARVFGTDFKIDLTLARGENLLDVEATSRAGATTRFQHRLLLILDAWDRVIAEVEDPLRAPVYRGLAITRLERLEPLRRDPASGLWEFLVKDSGPAPTFDPQGPYRVDFQTGVVLVLIPPQTFEMGSEMNRLPGTRTIYSRGDERPAHLVHVDAFYLSKYELTQAQWVRLAHRNRSFFKAGETHGGETMTLLHPAEKMTWTEAARLLPRWGLLLPTEAQWEAACRAGTTTPWSFGADPEELSTHGNVLDRSGKDIQKHFEPAAWSDGHPFTAPVGSYLPNPFGLFDMHGNVWEWCADGFLGDGYARLSPRDGDGFCDSPEAVKKAIRGGSYFAPFQDSRSAERTGIPPDTRARGVGVRPVLYPVHE